MLAVGLLAVGTAWAGEEAPAAQSGGLVPQLQEDLGTVQLTFPEETMEVELRWVSLETARNSQRMLDVLLEDNQAGAFLMAGEGTTVKWESVREIAKALKEPIAAYLAKKGITETRLQVGTEIGNYFLDREPAAPAAATAGAE